MSVEQHITGDPAYRAADPEDFDAMLDPERYVDRDTAFDGIIAKTHDHFWDPLDTKYIDFSEPFDLEKEALQPAWRIPELNSAVADKLDEKQTIQFINDNQHWSMSSIIHGEMGAEALSASLCHIFLDPGAQEYAANQTREEARHVTAFAEYVKHRWGKPTPCSTGLRRLLNEIVPAKEVYKKMVGMQLIIEGLAMGAFSATYRYSNDPVQKKLMQLVMTDEAFHHKFGKIWAARTVPNLSEEERIKVEDWAFDVFANRFRGEIDAEQKKALYAKYGLDWQWVNDAVREATTDEVIKKRVQDDTNAFRVVTKTLLGAGVISDRTGPYYEKFLDLKALAAEGDVMPGDSIAEEGIAYLQSINGQEGRDTVTISDYANTGRSAAE